MSIFSGPGVNTSGLQLLLDAINTKSYSGSGTTWTDITANRSVYAASNYTYPTWSSGFFTFVNNGVVQNNIYSSVQNITTSTQTTYTRIGWFYLTGYSSDWSPIIQNSIGNNADMCLCVSNNKLTFHQYTTTNDYNITGSTTINLNTWYQGVICVNRTASTVSLYVNGLLDSTINTVSIGNSASDTIVVGGSSTDSYGGNRMFKGRISQVSHYNTILTDDQISQNFNAFRGLYGL